MKSRTHYEVLRVAHDVAHGDIDAAYRDALTRAYRLTPPDSYELAAIREAHRVLSNGAERRAYNATLSLPEYALRTDVSGTDALDGGRRIPIWAQWLMVVLFLLLCFTWWRSPKPSAPVQVTNASTSNLAANAPVETAIASPADSEGPQRSAREVFASAGTSVGRVKVYGANGGFVGSGSAVIIQRETIITNCHVVSPGASATVEFSGRTYDTKLLVADEELDLCKLLVPGLPLPPVSISSVRNVHNGQIVYAIGAPGGGPVVVSEGVVTTLHAITAGNVIQTTAPIAPGSSGGGLFSETGKLIGIVTFLQRGHELRGYAIPIDWLDRMETREGSGQADQVVPPVYPNS